MMARPKKATDEAVFDATLRVMGRVGPGELSLALIAGEAGLTAGALVQRFGSKRDLLLAVIARWADGTESMLAGFRATRRSPLAVIRHWAACMGGLGETPQAVVNNLSWLQLDLSDPEFRAHVRRNAESTRWAFEAWLEEAVESGELEPATDVALLARLLEAVMGGSLLGWAVHQEGTAADWIVRDVDALLSPHRSA
jgi:AcrR family transcriptional regulator